MKLGVLSDTHLHQVTPQLKDLCEDHFEDVDMILHAGDWVSPEVVAFLSKRNLVGVHGNMDPHEIKKQLPEKERIQIGRHRLALVHGSGPSAGLEERIRKEFGEVDAIIYGHSHLPSNHRRNGVLLFNPGSATGFAPSGMHSVGILELNDTIRGKIIPV